MGKKKHFGIILIYILLVTNGVATALEPTEVAVIANSNSDDSVALAYYYARVRGIPVENIVLIRATDNYEISRHDYNTQIREPVSQYLEKKHLTDKVKCLVLMYGVPVRVVPKIAPPKAYVAAALKAHYRLAIDHQLLNTVAQKFPAPRTTSLRPVAKLFAKQTKEPRKPLMSVTQLQEDIHVLIKNKLNEIDRIDDVVHRSIAVRQMMALQLDMYGLDGLIKFIKENQIPVPGEAIKTLEKEYANATKELQALSKEKPSEKALNQRLALVDNTNGAMGLIVLGKMPPDRSMKANGTDAAVDSELAMLHWPNYELEGMTANPLYWRQRKRTGTPPTLMTSRIDGPSKIDAVRIIDNSLSAEKNGLDGTFYIDAGATIHKTYNKHFDILAKLVATETQVNVVLDKKPTVFPEGSCPSAALYVGWYSLRRYVPAFTWVPGAVGWHVASFEAMDLRNPKSNQWCGKMIQNGVAATIGAVNEPFLGTFPLPEEFFPLLLTGKYTVAECYWRTVPVASWRLTLIADPLYNPFKTTPRLNNKALPKILLP